MEIQSPFASLGKMMFTPQQTQAASNQQQNQFGRQYNTQTSLKGQAENTGIGRSLKAGLVGQGSYDASKRLAPIGQQFGDAQANAQWGQQVEGANAGYGLNQLGRTMQNQLQNQSPSIPLSIMNSQLGGVNMATNWLGQMFNNYGTGLNNGF